EELKQKRNLAVNVTKLCDDPPITIHENIIQSLKEACDSIHLPYVEMASGAGHDAMNLAKIYPTGLIFVPSKDGLSHNKDEFTTMEHISHGVKLLREVMMKESQIKNKSYL